MKALLLLLLKDPGGDPDDLEDLYKNPDIFT